MAVEITYRLKEVHSNLNVLSSKPEVLSTREFGESLSKRILSRLGLTRANCRIRRLVVRKKRHTEITEAHYYISLTVFTTPECQFQTILTKANGPVGNEIKVYLNKTSYITLHVSIEVHSDIITNDVKLIYYESKSMFRGGTNRIVFRLQSNTYCPKVHLNDPEFKALPGEIMKELTTLGNDQNNYSFSVCWDAYLSIMSTFNGVGQLNRMNEMKYTSFIVLFALYNCNI